MGTKSKSKSKTSGPRTHFVSVRLSDEESRQLAELARARGLERGALVRALLHEAMPGARASRRAVSER